MSRLPWYLIWIWCESEGQYIHTKTVSGQYRHLLENYSRLYSGRRLLILKRGENPNPPPWITGKP